MNKIVERFTRNIWLATAWKGGAQVGGKGRFIRDKTDVPINESTFAYGAGIF
jgi:hypothetical protein